MLRHTNRTTDLERVDRADRAKFGLHIFIELSQGLAFVIKDCCVNRWWGE